MVGIALICVGWGSNGNSTGYFPFYRYMISSYAAAFLIWAEIAMWRRSRISAWLLTWQAVVALYFTWMRDSAFSMKAHLTPLVQGPVVLTLFSWFPSLSQRVYRGTWFLEGPCLWTLTAITLAALTYATTLALKRVVDRSPE